MSFLLNLLGGISKKEHQAELDKMKNLYHEQIEEIQTAFRQKKESMALELFGNGSDEVQKIQSEHEAEMSRMKHIYESMISEIQEVFQAKLSQQQKEIDAAQEQMLLYKSNAQSHEDELEKMKKLYDEQLMEVQEAFRQKNASLQAQIDSFKAQIGNLLS